MATELEKIRQRIDKREEMNRADRERQRVLIRQRKAEGATWDQLQEEAGVSRPTLNSILNGRAPRRKDAKRAAG